VPEAQHYDAPAADPGGRRDRTPPQQASLERRGHMPLSTILESPERELEEDEWEDEEFGNDDEELDLDEYDEELEEEDEDI
jgi:hypothetical protein